MAMLPCLYLLFHLGLVLSNQIPLQIPESKTRSTANVLITPEIDQFVDSVLKDYGSPGLSVAVVRRNDSHPNGWLMEFGSYGVAQADGLPVTPDSLFAIASNSKLFLAFSVGLLIQNETLAEERGEKLSWSTKAKGLIPEWELMDKDMERIVNLQDMLSHRTGLPRHDFSGKVRKGGVLEMISTLRYLRPSAEVRETFQYNNLMYETLSYLPTLFFNQSYESYIAETLFYPLNMTGTTYSIAVAEGSGNFAHGYQRSMRDLIAGVNGTLTPMVPYFSRPGEEIIWAGAGGVISSARDLAKWVAMLLSDGRHPFTNQTVVPEEVVNHVAEGVTLMDSKPSYSELSATTYGAGQMRYNYRGHDLIEHGGSNPGFKTQVLRYPNDNLGIVILSNDEEYGSDIHEMVKWRITDEILGLEKIDWKSRIDAKNAKFLSEEIAGALPRPSNPSPPTNPVQSIEGKKFYHPTYGSLLPCYIGPKTAASASSMSSSHCSRVTSDPVVRKIVKSPFTRDTDDEIHDDLETPTIVIPIDQFFTTHILLRHFSGDLFNASTIWSNRDTRLKEGYPDSSDVIGGFDDRFEVEWVSGEGELREEGLAFKGGFWGKGKLAKAPGGMGKESAEVWFERVM